MEKSAQEQKYVYPVDQPTDNKSPFKLLTIFISLAIFYLFVFVNIFYAIARFHYAPLNDITVILTMLTPIILIIISIKFKQTALKIIGLIISIPLSMMSLLIAALTLFFLLAEGGFFNKQSFERIETIKLQSSNLIIYRTDGGATTDYGLIFRQERQILPGISLVKDLHSQYRCEGVMGYQLHNDGRVEIELNCRPLNNLTLKPKRFIYF